VSLLSTYTLFIKIILYDVYVGSKAGYFPSGVDYINNAVFYNLNYMMFQLLIGEQL